MTSNMGQEQAVHPDTPTRGEGTEVRGACPTTPASSPLQSCPGPRKQRGGQVHTQNSRRGHLWQQQLPVLSQSHSGRGLTDQRVLLFRGG